MMDFCWIKHSILLFLITLSESSQLGRSQKRIGSQGLKADQVIRGSRDSFGRFRKLTFRHEGASSLLGEQKRREIPRAPFQVGPSCNFCNCRKYKLQQLWDGDFAWVFDGTNFCKYCCFNGESEAYTRPALTLRWPYGFGGSFNYDLREHSPSRSPVFYQRPYIQPYLPFPPEYGYWWYYAKK